MKKEKVKRVFSGEESAALSGNKHIPDLDKKRADIWLMQLRVQFPSRQPPYGSIKNITYAKEGVKIAGGKGNPRHIRQARSPFGPILFCIRGYFKKAESGPVQGATVNRRLVEPTNSASMDILYTSLGIVKKRLHLKKTRNENRKGEWLFLALLPIPQVPCQKMLYTATAGTVKENLPVILRRRISALQLPTPIY